MGNTNGSSLGKPSIGTFLFDFARKVPKSGPLVAALKYFLMRQGEDIVEWFGDKFIAEMYIAMLREANEMLAPGQKLLLKMARAMISILTNDRRATVSSAAGKVLVSDNTVFSDKKEFDLHKIEEVSEYLLRKRIHTRKLVEAESLLVNFQLEAREQRDVIKGLKNSIENKNVLRAFHSIISFIRNARDLSATISDAREQGFKSLQFMVDYDYSMTLVQGGITVGLEAMEYFFENRNFDNYRGESIAVFHCGIGTSVSYKAGGMSLALHTEEPSDIDGFAISLGADPDGSGPSQEIAVACPMNWDSARGGIEPTQYTMGISDNYAIQKGVECNIVLYEIAAPKSRPVVDREDDESVESGEFDIKATYNKSGNSRYGDSGNRRTGRYSNDDSDEEEDRDNSGRSDDVSGRDQSGRNDDVDDRESTDIKGITIVSSLPSAGRAEASGNPSLYYSQFDWDELSSMWSGHGEKKWAKLGWDEHMWDRQRIRPRSADTVWTDLPSQQQRAAIQLGFDQKTWDAPTCMEAWRSADPNLYWRFYSWDQFLTHEERLWARLGWNERSWSGREEAPRTERTPWDDLTRDQEMAAITLGFTEEKWYLSSRHFTNDRWYDVRSNIYFADANRGKWFAREDWKFSRADLTLRDKGVSPPRDLETLTFTDIKRYKMFVMSIAKERSSTAEFMKTDLHVRGQRTYWEDHFQAYSPGLVKFEDIPHKGLDGFDYSYPKSR